MERIAAQSAWTGMNRFDSFAPLRVNVAAQWLVDGVSHLIFTQSEEGMDTRDGMVLMGSEITSGI
jgi:hypothetical protein